MCKKDLSHALGLTLSTPSLVIFSMQMSEDQDLIPTKDAPMYQMGLAGVELDLTVDSDTALLQQRMLVAKLSREEVEDRYLRLLEENTLLKKHACKQEEKIKKLATKLIRVISEKKRMEVASGGPGKIRDSDVTKTKFQLTTKYFQIPTEYLIVN